VMSDKEFSVLGHVGEKLGLGKAQGIANMLKWENIRSVNYRYDESSTKDTVKLESAETAQNLSLGDLHRLIRCFHYQSCETSDYYTTEAFKLAESIDILHCGGTAENSTYHDLVGKVATDKGPRGRSGRVLGFKAPKDNTYIINGEGMTPHRGDIEMAFYSYEDNCFYVSHVPVGQIEVSELYAQMTVKQVHEFELAIEKEAAQRQKKRMEEQAVIRAKKRGFCERS